jgi:hypothetical protein
MADDSRDTGPAPDARPPGETDAWEKELHEFVLHRFSLVQSAAQFWLGTMTTLVALFSALIVINQGESLAELPVAAPVRVGLYVIVVGVYLCAFGAVILGAQASFGGLSFGTSARISLLRHPIKELKRQWSPEPMPDPESFTAPQFRDLRQRRADRARRYLHRSRALGTLALVVAGVLALVVLAIGAFADDAPAPTYVVVIHDGAVTCGALERTVGGHTLIGGEEFEEVSHLTAVPAC